MKPIQIKPADLGSISHGTLREADLLSAFIYELEWQLRRNGDFFCLPENFALRDRLNNLVGEAQDCFTDDGEDIREDNWEACNDLLNDIMDALSSHFAPPYCYFGAHEGDGSDFGYWPSMGEIDELPAIADNTPEAIAAEQSDNYSTDVRYVNDHGNVTVYGADGSILLELV